MMTNTELVDFNMLNIAFRKCKKGGFLYLKFSKLIDDILRKVGCWHKNNTYPKPF